MSIKILPHHVVDQIAAGEVIERPAQLVKELIENSLDAGASEISIEYAEGGRYVKIADNGGGITPVDLPLAVARHATSKMSDYDDLWQLRSYGFRGEALASIAAVSRLRIQSNVPEHTAAELQVNFGQVEATLETRRPPGTTIEIKELFANVPARLKFMKSDSAESTQIKNIVKAMALVRPEITFDLKHENEMVAIWPRAGSYLGRVKDVFNVEELFSHRKTRADYTCEVVLSSPNVTAKTSKQIFVYVNGRYVQDRSVLAAVMDAYRGLLMHGEYPMGCIYLNVPTQELDINVSPTKSQVKFKDSSTIFRIVQQTCRELLEQAPWLQGILRPSSNSVVTEVGEAIALEPNLEFSEQSFARTQYARPVSDSFRMHEVREALSTMAQYSPPKIQAPSEDEALWSSLNIIGQAHLTYIVAEKAGGLIFVDQHAAHERVLYEKLMHEVQNKEIEVQSYLLPLTVDVTEEEAAAFMQHKDEMNLFGMEVEAMGPAQLAVNCAPAFMKEEGIIKALQKVAREMTDLGGSFAFEKSLGDVVATMACHSAIRAGKSLSLEEMQSLLQQMDDYRLSSFCPHGRPVYVEYPIARLERDFGRIV